MTMDGSSTSGKTANRNQSKCSTVGTRSARMVRFRRCLPDNTERGLRGEALAPAQIGETHLPGTITALSDPWNPTLSGPRIRPLLDSLTVDMCLLREAHSRVAFTSLIRSLVPDVGQSGSGDSEKIISVFHPGHVVSVHL